MDRNSWPHEVAVLWLVLPFSCNPDLALHTHNSTQFKFVFNPEYLLYYKGWICGECLVSHIQLITKKMPPHVLSYLSYPLFFWLVYLILTTRTCGTNNVSLKIVTLVTLLPPKTTHQPIKWRVTKKKNNVPAARWKERHNQRNVCCIFFRKRMCDVRIKKLYAFVLIFFVYDRWKNQLTAWSKERVWFIGKSAM